MTVRPFIAPLPKQTQIGDEVILKGRVKNNAEVFSVNFTLECCPNPLNIAYHFKANFMNKTVVHNYKTVGSWNDEVVEDYLWIDRGQEFILTFHFDDNEILVYSGDDDRCFQCKFGHKFDIGDIKSVQVWDDVESIDEIAFRPTPPPNKIPNALRFVENVDDVQEISKLTKRTENQVQQLFSAGIIHYTI